MSDKITLNLPCKKEYVVLARMTSSAIANKLSFDIEAIEDIKLAVSEACNNIIQHSDNTKNEFTVNFDLQETQLVIEIVDHGKGFDYKNYKRPSIEELKGNGLGLFIMQSLMDDVVIESLPNSGTVVKLIKHL